MIVSDQTSFDLNDRRYHGRDERIEVIHNQISDINDEDENKRVLFI